MKKKIWFVIGGVALVFIGVLLTFLLNRKKIDSSSAGSKEGPMIEITWTDLQKFDLKTNKLPDPIADKIKGSVKLPGFIVPLEANIEESTHFLFVPNQAYCVHVPPPPANLMVEVKSIAPVKNRELQGPIWLEGAISLEDSKNKFGTAAWQFKAVKHYPYEQPK